MTRQLTSKAGCARLVGVSRSNISKLCKTRLKPALVGRRIDLNHPAWLKYAAERDAAQTSEPAAPPMRLQLAAAALRYAADVRIAEAFKQLRRLVFHPETGDMLDLDAPAMAEFLSSQFDRPCTAEDLDRIWDGLTAERLERSAQYVRDGLRGADA